MQVIFTIEIKTDISAHDIKRREAFIALLKDTARKLQTKASLLSNSTPPKASVVSEDNMNGVAEYPLFNEVE